MATMLPRTLLALCLLMSACEEKQTPTPKPPATAKPAEKTDAFTELYNEGNLQREKFAYREALTAYEKALALCDKVADAQRWSKTAKQAAWTHQALGAYDKAEALFREILAQNDAQFGKPSPDSAETNDALVRILCLTGKLADAESLLRDMVDVCEDTLGKNKPQETTIGSDSHRLSESLFNLGNFLLDLNRQKEAEPIDRKALQVEIDCQVKTKIQDSKLYFYQINYRGTLIGLGDTEEQAQAKIDKMMEPLRKK